MAPRTSSLVSFVSVGVGAIALLALPSLAHAATVNVSDAASLSAAIDNAQAGDEIVLANGVYALSGVSCDAVGTAAAPIVVRAATPLGARIDFDGLEGFKVTGAHWRFEGLDIHGVCIDDPDCAHAFHVTGAAHNFVMRKNRVVDFDAQLKVNAAQLAGTWTTPNDGLVEYNELFDTAARDSSSPVTKLNIDTGDRWIVRGNFIHDFHRADGSPTYGAFMKSGGHDGLFERNLVLCTKDETTLGTHIGLSFGGGGTGPAFCAPAFDPSGTCDVEHENGTMRNNVIANCSDVGIYLNRSKSSHVLFNTVVGTTGIDLRFPTSSGDFRGNVLAGVIRLRDGAQAPTLADNLENVTQAQFDAMYVAPLVGDLRKKGDWSSLLGKAAAVSAVADDYCARARGAGPYDLGALQHSLGDCDTRAPVEAAPGSALDGGVPGLPGLDGGATDEAGKPDGSPSGTGDAAAANASTGGSGSDGDSGCGCRAAPATGSRPAAGAFAITAAAAAIFLRRARKRHGPRT